MVLTDTLYIILCYIKNRTKHETRKINSNTLYNVICCSSL